MHHIGLCLCGMNLDENLVYVVFPTKETVVHTPKEGLSETRNGVVHLLCRGCGAMRPETEFHISKNKKSGRKGKCKDCTKRKTRPK